MAKQTDTQKILTLLREGWTSPLDAWREWCILTSFRSRMAEIRDDLAGSRTERLEERWRQHKNRDGDRVQYKEFRIVKIGRPEQAEFFK